MGQELSAPSAKTHRMRYEEFTVGQQFNAGERTVTADALREFASAYDPQPLHLDASFAARSTFGHLIASGYHTLALSWRLWIDTGVFGEDSIAGLGLDEVRWLRPVVAGDRLTVVAEVLDIRPSASRPGAGIVRLLLRVRNQRSEHVLTYRTTALLRGRAL